MSRVSCQTVQLNFVIKSDEVVANTHSLIQLILPSPSFVASFIKLCKYMYLYYTLTYFGYLCHRLNSKRYSLFGLKAKLIREINFTS